jgi:carbonic anhydrase
MNDIIEYSDEHLCSSRRLALKAAVGVTIAGITGCAGFGTPSVSYTGALTKEERDKLTSDQIIEELKAGNLRFRSRNMLPHDYVGQKISSAAAQFPSAAILSCIDSRAPAEIIFDMGIGQSFNARVAGNIANNDLIGSLEFACAAAGAKAIVVMGHTSCGAIKGAIDNVALGNLTGLLDKIKPAIIATSYSGERSSKNDEFVDAVAKMNVLQTINDIRIKSDVLRSLEESGALKIVGAMYHLNGGKVEFELPAR